MMPAFLLNLLFYAILFMFLNFSALIILATYLNSFWRFPIRFWSIVGFSLKSILKRMQKYLPTMILRIPTLILLRSDYKWLLMLLLFCFKIIFYWRVFLTAILSFYIIIINFLIDQFSLFFYFIFDLLLFLLFCFVLFNIFHIFVCMLNYFIAHKEATIACIIHNRIS